MEPTLRMRVIAAVFSLDEIAAMRDACRTAIDRKEDSTGVELLPDDDPLCRVEEILSGTYNVIRGPQPLSSGLMP